MSGLVVGRGTEYGLVAKCTYGFKHGFSEQLSLFFENGNLSINVLCCPDVVCK